MHYTKLNPNSFFDILGVFYNGPVYPRYLYSYSVGYYSAGMFGAYMPLETLTIWYDQNTMVQYRGLLNNEIDTTVINGNYVDFENRNMVFDSLSIYFTELYVGFFISLFMMSFFNSSLLIFHKYALSN